MIEVTEAALVEFKRKLEMRGTPKAAIRFGVKGGGCSGYSFMISFEDEASERDIKWSAGCVDFVIDPRSEIILSGSTVTWQNAGTSKGFDIVNPNEASRCGCGRSFSVR